MLIKMCPERHERFAVCDIEQFLSDIVGTCGGDSFKLPDPAPEPPSPASGDGRSEAESGDGDSSDGPPSRSDSDDETSDTGGLFLCDLRTLDPRKRLTYPAVVV